MEFLDQQVDSEKKIQSQIDWWWNFHIIFEASSIRCSTSATYKIIRGAKVGGAKGALAPTIILVFLLNKVRFCPTNNVQNMKFIIECSININHGLAPLIINMSGRTKPQFFGIFPTAHINDCFEQTSI